MVEGRAGLLFLFYKTGSSLDKLGVVGSLTGISFILSKTLVGLILRLEDT